MFNVIVQLLLYIADYSDWKRRESLVLFLSVFLPHLRTFSIACQREGKGKIETSMQERSVSELPPVCGQSWISFPGSSSFFEETAQLHFFIIQVANYFILSVPRGLSSYCRESNSIKLQVLFSNFCLEQKTFSLAHELLKSWRDTSFAE